MKITLNLEKWKNDNIKVRISFWILDFEIDQSEVEPVINKVELEFLV